MHFHGLVYILLSLLAAVYSAPFDVSLHTFQLVASI